MERGVVHLAPTADEPQVHVSEHVRVLLEDGLQLVEVPQHGIAVGSVRGFALTLGLSTALDLIVSRLYMHPSVWLLDGNAKPLMQMPAGTGTFETVPEQLEILRLQQ